MLIIDLFIVSLVVFLVELCVELCWLVLTSHCADC
jgi:hypothetical protein